MIVTIAILSEDMKRVVREQRLGFVATVCADGTPNLSPKGTLAVFDDEHLVFADIRSPRSVENIERSATVEVNVVDPIRRKGYRFKGTANVAREGEAFEGALAFYEREFGLSEARERISSAVLIRVERVLPLTSPIYDLGRTEEEVAEHWWRRFEALRP
jgi:predicted pyridoxine 5'-phosphate oxidase superfamily flavin-nucleotide-binding protein